MPTDLLEHFRGRRVIAAELEDGDGALTLRFDQGPEIRLAPCGEEDMLSILVGDERL